MPKCWMCNNHEATTGEHVFKHSILKDMYGEKPLEKGDRLIVHAEKVYNGKANLKLAQNKCRQVDVKNLYKYFCKLFGCLPFSNSRSIPEDISDIVNGLNCKNNLGINVIFDVDLKGISEPKKFLVNHGLSGDAGHPY